MFDLTLTTSSPSLADSPSFVHHKPHIRVNRIITSNLQFNLTPLLVVVISLGILFDPVETSPTTISSAVSQPDLEFLLEHSGFNRPIDIENAGDGSKRLFIADQYGKVWIVDSTGTVLDTPFIDIDALTLTNGERGLLGLVFHPDYETNGYFFLNYTDNSSNTKIARYKVDANNANRADVSSAKVLMTINQPQTNHNGGDMAFSPIDGFLYIASGDGGGGGDPDCYAQDTSSLLGKMLRIDVNQNVDTMPYYGIPSSNPYAGSVPGRDEIWSCGLRNPWRFSFDRANGNMWIADVGQDSMEEVNMEMASSEGGLNYGWKPMEGTRCFDPDPLDPDCPSYTESCFSSAFTAPFWAYHHDTPTGGSSITGGYVYRGCKFPSLTGFYIAADFISDNVWLVDSLGDDFFYPGGPDKVTSFGETESGELYAATIGGNIYAVRDGAIPKVLVLDQSDSPLAGAYEAEDSIIVEGVVEIQQNKTAILTAPVIVVSEELSVDTTSLIQVSRNCANE